MSHVMLNKPAAGETVQVAIRNGQVYLLDFEPGETTWSNSGKDILIKFEDGSGMVLRDFFAAAKGGDFYLKLPDGAVLSGKDVVEVITTPLDDFHTNGSHASASGVHAPDVFSGAEAEQASGPTCVTHCRLPEEHTSQGQPFFAEALHESAPFGPPDFLGAGENSLLSLAPLAHPGYGLGATSSLVFFSSHNGGEPLHINELLDTAVPPSPGQGTLPGDIDSLLAPQTPPHQLPPSELRQEADSGSLPAGGHTVEKHSAATAVSSASFAGPGDESQDHALLPHLFWLSL